MEWLKVASEYGPLGYVLLALSWVVLKQFQLREADRKTNEAKIEELQEEKQALIEQRAQENAQRYADLVKAMGEQRAKSERPRTDYSMQTRTSRTRE